MTTKNILTPQHFRPSSYFKALALGWAIGLAAISVFVFGVDEPNPAWPEYWQVRPLLVTPVAAACGAAFFSFMNRLALSDGWKLFAVTIGMLGFVISLWLGTVLGLAGTMWD